eukprot:1196167-Prorocentrum_minimum.AAC.2
MFYPPTLSYVLPTDPTLSYVLPTTPSYVLPPTLSCAEADDAHHSVHGGVLPGDAGDLQGGWHERLFVQAGEREGVPGEDPEAAGARPDLQMHPGHPIKLKHVMPSVRGVAGAVSSGEASGIVGW